MRCIEPFVWTSTKLIHFWHSGSIKTKPIRKANLKSSFFRIILWTTRSRSSISFLRMAFEVCWCLHFPSLPNVNLNSVENIGPWPSHLTGRPSATDLIFRCLPACGSSLQCCKEKSEERRLDMLKAVWRAKAASAVTTPHQSHPITNLQSSKTSLDNPYIIFMLREPYSPFCCFVFLWAPFCHHPRLSALKNVSQRLAP